MLLCSGPSIGKEHLTDILALNPIILLRIHLPQSLHRQLPCIVRQQTSFATPPWFATPLFPSLSLVCHTPFPLTPRFATPLFPSLLLGLPHPFSPHPSLVCHTPFPLTPPWFATPLFPSINLKHCLRISLAAGLKWSFRIGEEQPFSLS